MTVVFPEILKVAKNIFNILSLHVIVSEDLETGTDWETPRNSFKAHFCVCSEATGSWVVVGVF